MKSFLPLLTILLASQSSAQDGQIMGRMICDVVGSQLVAARGELPSEFMAYETGFQPGMSLNVDYALDDEEGFTISLGEPIGGSEFIEELFSAATFKGVSRTTDVAEFRASYSEASIGRFGMHYKGSDQLFLRDTCGNGDWLGHFVQTHVGGHFTQVVYLECRPFVDAIDDVLDRLAIIR